MLDGGVRLCPDGEELGIGLANGVDGCAADEAAIGWLPACPGGGLVGLGGAGAGFFTPTGTKQRG